MTKINFTPFPGITTERLILRQLSIGDAGEIFTLRSDNEVNKFLDRQKAETINDARLFIEKINKGIFKNECIYWAVTMKEVDNLAGTICLWKFSEEESKAEIGFELLPRFQGKGIMQEALTNVIGYAFNVLNLDSIEGEVDPGNLKSVKLMKKNNFKLTRTNLKTVVYSLSNNKIN